MTMEKTIRALTDLSEIDRELVERATLTGATRAALEERRKALRRSIPASPLESYDALGRAGRRPALVELRSAHCGGCYLRLPPQIHSRIRRRESLCACPHCRRLLYWPPSGDGDEEPTPSSPSARPAPGSSKTASRRIRRVALLGAGDRRRKAPDKNRLATGHAPRARKSPGAHGKRRRLYQS
jgi:hypothetical protein